MSHTPPQPRAADLVEIQSATPWVVVYVMIEDELLGEQVWSIWLGAGLLIVGLIVVAYLRWRGR